MRDRSGEENDRARPAPTQIAEDPEVQAGAPTFKGTRVLVWPIVDALKHGTPEAELLRDYPALSREKLNAALLYSEVHPRRGPPKPTAPPEVPTSKRVVSPGRRD